MRLCDICDILSSGIKKWLMGASKRCLVCLFSRTNSHKLYVGRWQLLTGHDNELLACQGHNTKMFFFPSDSVSDSVRQYTEDLAGV